MQHDKQFFGLVSHPRRFSLAADMIIPQEMEYAVDQIEVQEFQETPTILLGLAPCGLQRDNYIPQYVGLNFRKGPPLERYGNDIGGTTALQQGLIQLGHGRIIHQGEAQFGLRIAQAS